MTPPTEAPREETRRIEVLEAASVACAALRATTAEGFTEDQRHAWMVAFHTIRSLADYIEAEHD